VAVFSIILLVTSVLIKSDRQPTQIPTHIMTKLIES